MKRNLSWTHRSYIYSYIKRNYEISNKELEKLTDICFSTSSGSCTPRLNQIITRIMNDNGIKLKDKEE